MQNALYFENSHVRPVPLLIGVKKKFLQRIITQKKTSCTAFTLEKISALLVSGEKKSFQGEIFQPPLPPSKVKWFAPYLTSQHVIWIPVY